MERVFRKDSTEEKADWINGFDRKILRRLQDCASQTLHEVAKKSDHQSPMMESYPVGGGGFA